MVLVSQQAPDFTAQAVVNGQIKQDFKLSDYRGEYVVLFFYPLDFTFVCPTELHAFQEDLAAFEERNTQVIGVSIDSCFSHLAWLRTPKAEGGIQGVTYPLVADLTKEISRQYGVLVDNQGVALRGLFLIDKEGVVQHQVVNNLSLGRSVSEVLRVIDALQFTEKFGEVCPANWQKGKRAMRADGEGIRDYYAQAS